MTASAQVTPYAERRAAVLARAFPAGRDRRRALSELTDRWLAELLDAATPDRRGVALVAVGGLGRRELGPSSDLDLVLLHAGRADVAEVAERVWYPIWDSGVRLDHSVRTVEQARRVAAEDLPAVLGMLQARHVAGDAALGDLLRSAILSDWRAAARRRLAELHRSCQERGERAGEVAFHLEPDLKEGRGGLRDVVALQAVAASWVADHPHGTLEPAATSLLDVRDALQLTTGRAGERLALQEQDAVARRLGLADADSLLRLVSSAGRTIAYVGELTWRRVEHVPAQRRRGLLRGPGPLRRPLAARLLEHEGEVVLDRDVDATADPVLPLAAAAVAAQAGLALAPHTLDRLSAECPPLPRPWPAAARDALVALLGAGPPAVPVWEALDQAGLTVAILPEWGLVRSRPQRNPLHRYTVDRHLVEAAAQAARLTRRVARPDLLLVGALLHDIGKGRRRPSSRPWDHSTEGAAIARPIAEAMGFAEPDVQVLSDLVRHHLLLADTATRRDLHDPATVEGVAATVRQVEVLDLLHALTEADALATGVGVWSDWRAGLVAELVRRTRAHLEGDPPAPPPPLTLDQQLLVDAGELAVHVQPRSQGWAVTVVAPDQRGLFAAVAGVLALHRLSVRSATVRTENGVAIDVWTVMPEFGDPPVLETLREDVRRALAHTLDVTERLRRREATYSRTGRSDRVLAPAPRVDLVDGASATATVVEVRAHDRLGLLHRLGRALSLAGVDIRSATVTTFGAEAVDVFYVLDETGRPLSSGRAREVARVLRDAAG